MNPEHITLVARTEIDGVKFQARLTVHRTALDDMFYRGSVEASLNAELANSVLKWLTRQGRVAVTKEESPF